MNATHLRRSFVAVASAITVLVVMAGPAAATGHDVTITGGQITLTKTGVTDVIDLAPATPPCSSAPTPTLDLDVTGTAISVTDFDAVDIWTLGGPTALRVLTRSGVGDTAGTYNATTGTFSSLRVGIAMTFYTAYDATTCAPTGTPVCTLAFLLHLSGTLSGTTVSSTVSLTGSSVGSVVAFPTCTAGPSILIGTTATVTSAITGHLTT